MAQQALENDGSFLASTFYLGDTVLGVDTLRVQEIIKVPDITSVHHAPKYVLGVINLRGRIVTVLDLKTKLSFEDGPITEDSRIIIVDSDDEYVGLLVDAISDVIVADNDNTMPAPANIEEGREKYFRGVYHADQGLIAILDVEKVLSTDDK
jgi:purine-binding chemotaxis protein CheW